jgi:DNA-binding CsgD family transcriptional regulator
VALWDKLNALFDSASSRTGICLVFLGLGLCRACLGWSLSLLRTAAFLPPFPLSAHQILDLGELIGFVLIAFVSTRRAPVFRETPSLLLSTGMLAIGLVSLGVASLFFSVWAFFISCFVVGISYGSLFLLWTEFYGRLAPKSMSVAYACSYLVSFIFWLAITSSTVLIGMMLASVCALCSSAALISSYRKSVSTLNPNRIASLGVISWPVVTWLSIFAFGYGIGDSITASGYATLVSKIGMAIPAAIVVLAALFMSEFDLTGLYRLSAIFMLAGLSVAILASGSPMVSQLLMSAANEAYCLLGMTAACTACHRRHQTTCLYCGALSSATLVFTQAGETLGKVLLPYGSRTLIDFVVLGAVIAAALVLFKERDISEQVSLKETSKTLHERDLLVVANQKGLTAREQSVFLMLTQGKSMSEIGEELFISSSAVRSHAGSIYRKFGVHSRKEFDKLISSNIYPIE